MFKKISLNTIQFLAIALVFIIPLIFFKQTMFPFQIIKTVTLQSIIEIIVALWISLAIFDKKFRPKFTALQISILAYALICTLSAIFGIDIKVSLWSTEARSLGLVSLWHFVLLFFALSSLKNEIKWNQIINASIFSAALVSLIGIGQWFGIMPKSSILFSGDSYYRIGSTFSNSAFMAGYLLFNLFLCAERIASGVKNGFKIFIKNWRQVALSLSFILILIAIFLSQTMGVIVGLFAGVALMIIIGAFNGSDKNKKIFKFIFVAVLIFATIFWVTKDSAIWQKIPGLNRISSSTLQSASIRDRLITWKIGLESFKQKPILGWGFENFRIAFDKNYDPNLLTDDVGGTYWDKPHNVIVEHLSTTGALGLITYLSIFVALFYSIKKSSLENKFIYYGMFVAYFIQNLFVFDTIGTYMMFFVAMAYIENSQHKKDEIIETTKNDLVLKTTTGILVLLAVIGIYFNTQIFKGASKEYWGVNYYLNGLTESSLISFSGAVDTITPYKDDIKHNFANTVKQAYQKRIEYPKIDELQKKLVEYLGDIIERHPNEFLNHLILAEFLATFNQFDPEYISLSIKHSEEALRQSPNRQQVYFAVAKAYFLNQDKERTYKTFEDVIALNPNAGDPHFVFGLTAYGFQDVKTGKREIEIAKSLGRLPRKADEAIALGNYAGDYDANYAEALRYYKLALNMLAGGERLNANNQQRQGVLLKAGLASYFANNIEEAKYFLNKLAQEIDLKSIPIYSQLRPILIELGVEEK